MTGKRSSKALIYNDPNFDFLEIPVKHASAELTYFYI